jgi:hypothetical protein
MLCGGRDGGINAWHAIQVNSTLITTHLTNDRRKVFAVSLWWRGAVLIFDIR